MARGRKARVVTTEMVADIKVLSKEQYIEKHNVGEMFYLNMYYKCVSPKDEQPKFFDIFEGILADTGILYEKGAADWLKHVSSMQSECDQAIQDILHRIQLENHTNAEKIKMFDLLKDWRIKRVLYTDSIDFFNTNKHKVIDFLSLMNGIYLRKKFIKGRVYRVRKLASEFGKDVISMEECNEKD